MSTLPAGTEPAAHEPLSSPPHRGRDRVLGGVCSGLAARLGLDPWAVRVVALLLLVLSGGSAVLVYLLAWVLMPQSGAPAGATGTTPEGATPEGTAREDAAPAAERPGGVRDAWSAVGADVRSLATGLAATPRTAHDLEAPGPRVAPLDAADAAATRLGDRLRSPEVRAAARQAAARFGEAVNLSAEELTRRTSRR